MLGRKLRKDEDVHHRNGNKRDFRKRNLQVLGHEAHGYVTALQHFYVPKIIEERERQAYEEFGMFECPAASSDWDSYIRDDSSVLDTSFP